MFAPYEFDDIVERVLSAPPVDTKLRFGVWHRDRLTWRGIWLEAKVLGKSWVVHRNRNVKKFLIIGRARSGTTLLTDLLNAHPDVTCDREMLHRSVISPATYLDNLAQKSCTSAYGAKLLSYQMAQVQRLRYPEHFLAGLHDRGFRLIHLKRNTFDQTLSLMMAQKSGKYHSRENNIKKDLAYLDPQDFYQRLEWSAMLLEYEKHVLRKLPHISISNQASIFFRGVSDRNRRECLRMDWCGSTSGIFKVKKSSTQGP